MEANRETAIPQEKADFQFMIAPLSKRLTATFFIVVFFLFISTPVIVGWFVYHHSPKNTTGVEQVPPKESVTEKSRQIDIAATRLGYGYHLKNGVIYFFNNPIDADAETFRVDPPPKDEYTSSYEGVGIDKESIFWYGTELKEINPEAYKVIFCQSVKYSICGISDNDQLFVLDEVPGLPLDSNTYTTGYKVSEVDVSNPDYVEFIEPCTTNPNGPYYWKDTQHVGCGGKILKNADPANFSLIHWRGVEADARSGIYLYNYGVQLDKTLVKEKTYTDTENGFSFTYPGDYVLTGKDDPIYEGSRFLLHMSEVGRETEVFFMKVSVTEDDGKPLESYIEHDAGNIQEDIGHEVSFELFDQATTSVYAQKSLTVNGMPAAIYRRNYFSTFGAVIRAVFLLDNGKILRFEGESYYKDIEKVLLSVTRI